MDGSWTVTPTVLASSMCTSSSSPSVLIGVRYPEAVPKSETNLNTIEVYVSHNNPHSMLDSSGITIGYHQQVSVAVLGATTFKGYAVPLSFVDAVVNTPTTTSGYVYTEVTIS